MKHSYLLAVLLALPVRAAELAEPIPLPASVAFLTDFGTKDPAVGICKLAMAQVNPIVPVIDLSHQVTPFNVEQGANFLAAAVPHSPRGTVFVGVVDPGVGGERKSIAVKTKSGHFLVGPDNGLLAKAAEALGVDKIVELTNAAYFRDPNVSSTFHGRDVYAPVGAHLASGVPIEKLGPELRDLKPLDVPKPSLENGTLSGRAVYNEDPFGSVLTDIPAALVEKAGLKPGDVLEITLGGKTFRVPFHKTFSDVAEGAELALIASRRVFSLSVNRGDFARRHAVVEGSPIVVRRAR